MVVILMGVTGTGKTTVGKLLTARLGWSFVEADDFHPPANVEKMHRGIPLDYADRRPWLGRPRPRGRVRLDNRFRERDRADGGVLEVSERVRVAERRPNPLSVGKMCLTGIESEPKLVKIFPNAIIWERSVIVPSFPANG